MRPPVTWGHAFLLGWLVVAPPVQTPEPLRKTDLIRLLTGGTMSTSEIADLVKRNCVSFTPTARDRENLASLGADSILLARIDACLHARSAPAATHPATPKGKGAGELLAVPLVSRLAVPVGGTVEIGVALKRGTRAVSRARLVLQGSAAVSGGAAARDVEAVTDGRGIALFRFPAGSQPGLHRLTIATATGEPLSAISDVEVSTVPAAPAAAPAAPVTLAHPAAARTGFVLGTGQRGVVGQRAVLPLVFEVRDAQGGPIPAFPVQWSVVNGQLVGPVAATDSTGQARADVVFGQLAGPTVVTGTAGGITRQATLYANPGRPARLVVERGGAPVDRQLLVSADGTTLLRVYCRDGFDNPLPLTGLVAVVGDEGIVRVTAVTSDSLGGWVTLRPGKDGRTNLTVQGSGVRADLSAMVKH